MIYRKLKNMQSVGAYISIIACFHILCTTSTAVYAQNLTGDELKLVQSAANNSSHEFTECSANYMMVAQCMNNTKAGSGEGYSNLAENFLKKAIALGEVASVKEEVISKRLDISVNDQIGKMDGCQNIMMIWGQTKKCNAIAESGVQNRLKAWINRLAHRFPKADPDKLTSILD